MDSLWIILLVILVILITSLIILKIYTKLTTRMCKSDDRMDGKTVIITGANIGIGYETALELARRGARVILACRNEKKANDARDKIIAATGNSDVVVRLVDLISLESIRNFAKDILSNERYIHVLINNASAFGLGSVKTKDGFLPMLETNYFCPFLLTNLLLGRLIQSTPSRVITIASAFHFAPRFDVDDITQTTWRIYNEILTYNNSKLLNIMMSNELARKLEGTGVTSNSVHPGATRTGIMDHSLISKFAFYSTAGLFFKTAKEGAQTTIYVAVDRSLQNTTGQYFANCRLSKSSAKARDPELIKKVWEISEKLVQLQDSEKYYNFVL